MVGGQERTCTCVLVGIEQDALMTLAGAVGNLPASKNTVCTEAPIMLMIMSLLGGWTDGWMGRWIDG